MFVKFPKIRAFHGMVSKVRKMDNPPSTIAFTGTVKLHGTNAAIGFSDKHGLWTQSRTRVITPASDNFGFSAHIARASSEYEALLRDIARYAQVDLTTRALVVFGEFCGAKIQKGVALTGLPLMFVVFDACSVGLEGGGGGNDEDCRWIDFDIPAFMFHRPDLSLYPIALFGVFTVTVDFFNLPDARTRLIAITDAVEKECPAGKYFGRSAEKGDCLTGEGLGKQTLLVFTGDSPVGS